MRVVTVKAPEGKGTTVADLALSVGIAEASVTSVYVRGPNHTMDRVEVETSTPKAKKFVDALMAAPYYNPRDYHIAIRGVLAIVNDQGQAEATFPVYAPTVDVCEELWQFSHITLSFIIRVLVASLLLAYGMIQNHILIMAAGLLFIPFLPLIMAMSFGAWTRDWRLARQGLATFVTGVVVITLGSALVAFLTGGPLRFDQFGSLGVGLAISLVVGVAANAKPAVNPVAKSFNTEPAVTGVPASTFRCCSHSHCVSLICDCRPRLPSMYGSFAES